MSNCSWPTLAFFCLSAILCTCAPPPTLPAPEPSIYPISVKVNSLVHKFPDMGLFSPDINFDFLNDSLTHVTVGGSEILPLEMQSTRFPELLKVLTEADLKNSNYWYNPYQKESGTLEITKQINDSTYTSIYSEFVRQDIPVRYTGMTIEMGPPVAELSDYAHQLAYELLRDSVRKEDMLITSSLSEALKQPGRVHTLNLRNKRISSLPSRIGEFVNLRVLNISGSWIRELPPEIGNCRELRSLIANASRLQKIPSEIGQLKKLRNLNIGFCRLTELPEEIGELRSLWTASLGGNRLNKLPGSIRQWDSVVFFSADDNELKEFPKAVLGLRSVNNLWLHGNDFTQIPKELADLPELSHFLVDAKEIENIDVLKKARPWVRVIDENGR